MLLQNIQNFMLLDLQVQKRLTIILIVIYNIIVNRIRLYLIEARVLHQKKIDEFIKKNNIEHIKTAVRTPEANGQVERINKTLTPMLAKMCSENSLKWDKLLPKIEYVFNNTYHRSINNYPSVLLFGVQQNPSDIEKHNIECFIQNNQPDITAQNIQNIREKARRKNLEVQNYNKSITD